MMIRSARQMKNVLRYVLRNCERHGEIHPGRPDPYSSAAYFRGFADYVPDPAALRELDLPVSPPRSALQRDRWRVHGPFPVSALAA